MTDYSKTYTGRKILQANIRNWATAQDADYFITAVFNRDVSVEGAWQSMQHWCNCINRKLYGKKWHKLATNDRVHFIAFAEHLDSNLHWHLMLKTGTGRRAWKFRLFAEYLWQKHNQSGGMDIQKLVTLDDQKQVARYVTKDIWQARNYDSFKLSA